MNNYGFAILSTAADMAIAHPRGIITENGVKYLCGNASNGAMVIINGETKTGYCIDFDSLFEIAKANNWEDPKEQES